MLCSAVFLNRDVVTNYYHAYLHKREEFDFIKGVFDIARHAHYRVYKLVIITNQAVIASCYYTELQFLQLTDWMCQRFLEEGAQIDRVYFSPCLPTADLGQHLGDDFSRKTLPIMIHRVQKELYIDLSHSVLIGDNDSNIQAGIASGVCTNLLLTADHFSELNKFNCKLIATICDATSYLQQGAE